MLTHLNAKPQKPQRVVVMGAGGFVGKTITAQLKAEGVDVLALGRGDVDLLADGAGAALAALIKPTDAFVAVSALAPVKNLEMLGQNITMISAMAEALATSTPAHVLNIGSDAVFGDEPLPLTEDAPKAPGAFHGVMHTAREVAFEQLSCPVATLRPTLIYGAEDPHNGYGPNRFRRMAAAGEDITLFGEGEERRDHVLVDDVANLAVRMLMHKSTGSLNAATGQVWSFREIASMVVNLHATPVKITGSPRQGDMPHGGYRPFDPSATFDAFADFTYTALPDGLAQVHAQTQG